MRKFEEISSKSVLEFAFFILVASFSLATLSHSSVEQNVVLAFLGANGTWLGYIMAHYSTEGKFVDGNEEDEEHKMVPNERKEISGSIFGSTVLIGGMVLGAFSLKSSSFYLTFLAALIFFTGYIIAHYSATGELL